MAERKQPRRWLFFALDTVPPTLPIPTYRWANRPIVYQAFPAFIEGRVVVDGWQDIVRAASSMSGEYNIDHGSVILADTDALIRGLLDDPSTLWFERRMGHFMLLSDTAIRDSLTPGRQLFAGRCTDVQLLDDRGARLEFEDILAPYMDRLYPQYRLVDAYPHQAVPPPASIADTQAAWAFLGTTGNFGDGDTVTIGANVYTFQTTLTNVAGHVHIGGSVATSLSNLVAAITAGAGSGTAYAAATVVHPDVTAALSDAGEDLGSLGSLRVTALVDGVEGNAIATTTTAANGWWFNEGGVDSPTLMHGFVNEDLNVVDPEVQAPVLLLDQVIPTYYGPHVQTAVDPATGLPVQGICPAFFTGFTYLEAGGASPFEDPTEQQATLMSPYLTEAGFQAWGELTICSGNEQVPNGYGSNLADLEDVPEGEDALTPSSVLLDEARYGVDILAPGHTGWPFDTDYVMRNGFMLTVIYARGPLLWAHLTGEINITVDVCGWPDADGDPIDQAAFAWQDFLTQHVIAHDGAGFTSGPALTTLPMFDPTVDIDRAMFWTSKVQAMQAVTAERLGTEKGYLISMGLTQPTALREILRTWHVTFDAFSAKNSAGQLYPFVIDDLASPDDGVPIRERIELLRLPAPRIAKEETENEIDYTVGWDHVRQEPRTTTITKRSQYSIDALKGDVRKVDGIRNLAYTADDATARDAMGRRLLRLRQAPRYQQLPLRTDGVDREIGEQVRVSHQDGFGPRGVGYNLRAMLTLKSVHHGDNVTLEALDLRQILTGSAEWGPDSLPDDSVYGTEEDVAQYWIWTDDDGTIPIGGNGSEWR